MRTHRLPTYIGLSVAGVVLLTGLGWWSRMKQAHDLPSQQVVLRHFESHKADYIHFAAILRKDQSARHIGSDGAVVSDGTQKHLVPEYRDLMRRIGAQFVDVRKDGSMEFALWGSGCAICSDSYMGLRYYPNGYQSDSSEEWKPTVVTSLDTAKLPHQNGSIASGLYVVPIDSEWCIYRSEYRE